MGRFSDEVVKQCRILLEYLREYADLVNSQRDKFEQIYELLERSSKAIHVYGIGRSGSAAVSLALRLKHFNYNVWFIGDVVKERIRKDDTVILFSGSGETAEIVNIAESAKREGAKIVAICSYEDSALGKLADVFFYLPGGPRVKAGNMLRLNSRRKHPPSTAPASLRFSLTSFKKLSSPLSASSREYFLMPS